MTEEDYMVFSACKKLTNTIARQMEKNRKDKKIKKLPQNQSIMLCYIAKHSKESKVYQKDIEKQFSIQRSTATEQLQKLESAGLIKRTPSKQDARLKEITLTSKALAIEQKITEQFNNFNTHVLSNITSEEKQTFISILNKMTSTLEGDNND